MPAVELTDQEWADIQRHIATKCLWIEANPLLMRIDQGLRKAANGGAPPPPPPEPEPEK